MNVRNTYTRSPRTVFEKIDMKQSVRASRDHGRSGLDPANILVPKSNFDYGVMIAVGLLRFFLDYQRDEIPIPMESKGIAISTGEISNLSEKFLQRF